jgi:hypothetical protein
MLAEDVFNEDTFSEKEITVNKDIPLAGDSIWMNRAGEDETQIDSVHVSTISVRIGDEDDEDDNTISVYAEHDGPYQIYTDSGFEKAISDIIGYEVGFSEQGMQEDGQAHLEGYTDDTGQEVDEPDDLGQNPEFDDDYDPLDRVKHLAGVEPVIEDDETDDEEPIEEAQSPAQKAAFQKMLDAKNGKKEETTDETDDDKDEVSETLNRVKHLAGV